MTSAPMDDKTLAVIDAREFARTDSELQVRIDRTALLAEVKRLRAKPYRFCGNAEHFDNGCPDSCRPTTERAGLEDAGLREILADAIPEQYATLAQLLRNGVASMNHQGIPVYVAIDAMRRVAALTAAPATVAGDDVIHGDVVRLVIAARNVAFGDPDRAAIKELDAASEAFAARIPWADEPADATPPQPVPAGDWDDGKRLYALANTAALVLFYQHGNPPTLSLSQKVLAEQGENLLKAYKATVVFPAIEAITAAQSPESGVTDTIQRIAQEALIPLEPLLGDDAKFPFNDEQVVQVLRDNKIGILRVLQAVVALASNTSKDVG